MQPLYTESEFKSSKSRQLLPLHCLHCNQTFHRHKNFITIALQNQKKGRKYAADFCSIQCHNLFAHSTIHIDVICKQCGTKFTKLPSQTKDIKHHFCSHSCAAKYNIPRRPRKYLCLKCQKPIRKTKSRICVNCLRRSSLSQLPETTKGELKKKRTGYQSYRSAIRGHAQFVFQSSGIPMKCRVCGYEKHVEIAHIKSVKSFPDTSMISEINDIKNLMTLCPTHHWEHDNGILNW